jgi:hypothetical protein
MTIQTSQLITLAKTKIYALLTAEDQVNDETGEVYPAVNARDMSSLTSSIINISKHEQELKERQGLGNKVMAFPAVPEVKKQA